MDPNFWALKATLHFLGGHISHRLWFLGATFQPMSEKSRDAEASLFLEDGIPLPAQGLPMALLDFLRLQGSQTLPPLVLQTYTAVLPVLDPLGFFLS